MCAPVVDVDRVLDDAGGARRAGHGGAAFAVRRRAPLLEERLVHRRRVREIRLVKTQQT